MPFGGGGYPLHTAIDRGKRHTDAYPEVPDPCDVVQDVQLDRHAAQNHGRGREEPSLDEVERIFI